MQLSVGFELLIFRTVDEWLTTAAAISDLRQELIEKLLEAETKVGLFLFLAKVETTLRRGFCF